MKIVKITVSSIILVLLLCSCFKAKLEETQITEVLDSDDDLIYCGQKVPTHTPVLFAPDLISKPDIHEFGCTFSKHGKEIYFGIDEDGKASIHYSKLENDAWTSPVVLLSDSLFSYNDPMLSPNENRLYFISDQSIDSSNTKKDIDIWYIERNEKGWSSPINAGENINSPKNEYYISFTESGKMYFASNIDAAEDKQYNFDIYSAEASNNGFAKPIKLHKNVNTSRYEADVFIAPDESYIIFCSMRRSGLGKGDLYISFKDENGEWMPSKNMDKEINTANHELCPFVSKDGKYLFYTSNQDIYWVSTDILQAYK